MSSQNVQDIEELLIDVYYKLFDKKYKEHNKTISTIFYYHESFLYQYKDTKVKIINS